MGVPLTAAVVLDHQVHLLDPLFPDDRPVFPELGHRHVALINPRLAVNAGAHAAIAIALTLVGNIADRPSRRCCTRWLVKHLQPNMGCAVAIIDRRGPILGAVLVDQIPLHIKMRLARLRVIGIGLCVSKGGVKQYKLIAQCSAGMDHEKSEHQGGLDSAIHGRGSGTGSSAT